MAKTNKERQKEWRERHKKEEAYKIKRNQNNKKCYTNSKAASPTTKLAKKVNATLRKRKSRLAKKNLGLQLQAAATKLSPSVVGKLYKKVNEKMPKSPRKIKAVISRLNDRYSDVCNVTPPDDVITRNRVAEDVRNAVAIFYETDGISRVDPGFKSASVKRKTIKARRHLLYTITEAYNLFIADNPGERRPIGRSLFASLRPSHVKPYKDIPHNVCVCRYHENFSSLFEVITKSVPGYEQSVDKFLSTYVCDTSQFKCMSSECIACKNSFDALFNQPIEDPEIEVRYKQWKLVDKRSENISIDSTLFDAIQELKRQLPVFLLHVFHRESSQSHFNTCRTESSPENITMQVDFAENYACQYQNEIQAAHWNNPQVAVFTAVIWYGPGNTDSYAVVADDITHDRYCVDTFIREVLDKHQVKNPQMTNLRLFSDGCASQFKQKYNFCNMTFIKRDYKLKNFSWTFFATSHGKGAVDGIGAVVKRHVWSSVRSTNVAVRSAEKFAEVCANLKVEVIYVPSHNIETNKAKLDDAWEGISTLKGTQKMHHITAKGLYVVGWQYYPKQSEPTYVNMRGDAGDLGDSGNDLHEDGDNPTIENEDSDDDIPLSELRSVGQQKPFKGQWVTAIYDDMWVPGTIEDLVDGDKINVKFMKIIGPNRFMWPEKDDRAVLEYSSTLCDMNEFPTLISYSGRGIYSLSAKEFSRILELFLQVK